MTKDIFILGGRRTPMTAYVGALKDVKALDLGAAAARGALEAVGVAAEEIDHTVVVREREAQAPTFEQVFSAPTSDAALRRSFKPLALSADLSALTPAEVEVVEAYLRRRWDMEEMPRQWMAWRIATPLLDKLRPGYEPADFTYEGFLEELLHRYRATHRFEA